MWQTWIENILGKPEDSGHIGLRAGYDRLDHPEWHGPVLAHPGTPSRNRAGLEIQEDLLTLVD
jgi:hypothetical protein